MRYGRWWIALGSGLALATFAPQASQGDVVALKSGVSYRGEVDKDNTILSIFCDRKRIIIRDTKVASITSSGNERYELFHVDQPLTLHAGAMPSYAMAIKAGPWSREARRAFEYIGPGSTKPVRMTQAINELGPKSVHLRGVDGFWKAQLATSEVPRPVVLGLLARVERGDQNERLKVGRFLIQAEWYDEALEELDRIERDFPALSETVERVRVNVQELRARQWFAEIEQMRKAGQLRAAEDRLRTFPTEGAGADLVVTIAEQIRRDRARGEADAALAQSVSKAAEGLPADLREANREATLAMLRDLADAPEAVRDRFGPFTATDAAATAETRYSRALSGWLAGEDGVLDDLPSAEAMARASRALQAYLGGRDEAERAEALATLKQLESPDPATGAASPVGIGTLTKMARLMLPPLRDPEDEKPGRPKLLRARDDDNAEPTEYVVVLPPEYHPLRSYPAVVAVHAGNGPLETAQWWAAEAARRGYVVIAPEYNLQGQPRDYRYSSSEHAAVVIALRDARKRFAIDPDRVFLGGVLLGGNMAWDFGLAHPDHFAGVAIISGLPAKYAWAYRENAKHVPLFVTLGDLIGPNYTDILLPFSTGLIARNYDVTHVEYYKRGLEPLPEELPEIFDWMDAHRREPYPKEFRAVTAREGDDRFFGVVVREFAPRRAVAPEQADPLGKNLKPATIDVKARSLANVLDVSTSGLSRIDLWFGPPHIDVAKRFELRINGRTAFKGLTKIDIAPFLEDLRVRGDRKQVYWLRYQANVGGARPR
jgi:pimeloyl-ACP methyl ester carboxylesterase